MNIWQFGFVVRSGVSALVVAFLLGYAAHYQWGFSRAIRNARELANPRKTPALELASSTEGAFEVLGQRRHYGTKTRCS